MNYFLRGKTNAKAEAMNSKLQWFVTVNYEVRDKDFLCIDWQNTTRSTSN